MACVWVCPAQPSAVEMFTFNSPKVVDKWHVFTDACFGGRSQAAFKYNVEEQAAEFSGRVTLDQEEDADIKRAGYCVSSSKVTHIADYFDLSGCTHLVLDIKGDGRTYIANVRTDSIAGTGGDVWQAPFKTSAGEWRQVWIPLQSLMLTYQGQLVKRRLEFQANQVISVGVAASAMPEADAMEGVPDPDSLAELSSTTSTASIPTELLRDPDGSSGASSSISSDLGITDSIQGNASSLEPAWDSEADSITSYPEHEQFKLLIRSIQAEVEF